MNKNKVLSITIIMLFLTTFYTPMVSADSLLAILKDDTVIQTTLSDEVQVPSVPVITKDTKSDKSLLGNLFDLFNNKDSDETQETDDEMYQPVQAEPTESPTPEPTATATLEPTLSPEPTATLTPTEEPTATPTAVPITITANDMSIETVKNTTVTGTLTASSTEDNLVFAITVPALHGTPTLIDPATGSFQYVPNTDYVGDDSFKFTASAGGITSAEATVSILIKEITATPTPVTTIYDDMIGHYAQAAAEALYNENYVRGETVGNETFFYPDYTMSRVQFVTFANTIFKTPVPSITGSELPFVDITAETPDYIINAATNAYRTGLVKGSMDNGQLYFRPFDDLTRVEVLVILHNVINPPKAPNMTLDFTDASQIPAYATDYVKDMINIGMIKGFDDGSFRPFDKITRAQAAVLLYNAMGYVNGTTTLMKLK